MRKLFLLAIIGLMGCKTSLTPMEFAQYCNDSRNGLIQSEEKNEVRIELKYLPKELMALHEFHGEFDRYSFDSVLETYHGIKYFNLKLIPVDKKTDVLLLNAQSKDQYYQRVQYFSSMINQDLEMVIGKDTIPCSIHHYERTYQLSPVVELMIGFEDKKPELNENISIIYDDKIFALGKIIMKIEGDKISKIPALKL